MLCSLKIQNYVLIQQLNFKPQEGLNTITGETGAGKSILLGALGLITGQRADVNTLLDKEQKCIVEASFDIGKYNLHSLFETLDLDYETKTLIRREINPAGKSRAFINDSPVTLDVLKTLGNRLIDIHSQNETQQLHTKEYQEDVLDFLSDSFELKKEYTAQYKLLRHLKKQLLDLQSNAERGSKEQEYNLFLLNELSAIKLEEINQKILEDEVKSIENFSEIKSNLAELDQIIESSEISISSLLALSLQQTKNLAKLSGKYSALDEQMLELSTSLQELYKIIVKENESLDIDEDNAQLKLDQYTTLQNLLRKHKVLEVAELIALRDQLIQKTNLVANFDQEISKIEKKLKEENKQLVVLGEKLHKNRSAKSEVINQKIISICQLLGISEAGFKIEFTPTPQATVFGLYDIQFMFSANKGIALQEMSKAASGGEFSRLMFAVKSLLAEKIHLPTIIFDEIDTGISGEIALKMGALMQKMGENHQMICITHLPQIAAKGQHHFFVYKDHSGQVSSSNIRKIESEERIGKIAEMIGGNNPGQSAINSAIDLIGEA